MNNAQADFTNSFHKNVEIIKEQLHHTTELVVRTIRIGETKSFDVALLYLDDLVNADVIRDFIITPLFLFQNIKKNDTGPFIDNLASRHIRASSVEIVSSFEDALGGIVRGRTLILVDGYDSGIIAETTQWQQRSVEQSSRQRSPAGPMIGLSEQLKVNLNLIRSFIKSPDLVVEMKQLGKFAKTDLSIVYLNNKVDQQALENIRKRIDTLDVDYVLESRVVEDVLEGKKKTIFPLIFNTEMPDIVAAALYEGRIAVLVDGTPQASIAPSLFVQFMAQPNEYYSKTGKLTNRLILFFSYFLSVFLPGMYVAVAKFHKNWVPAKFAKTYFTHSDTILPLFLEMTLMILIISILILAAFRIQSDMIIVVSLVGTMVISTTAVDAKLVHPLSLIITGIAFLTNFLFVTGGMASAAFSLRFLFLIIGSFFGLTAMGIGFLLLILYMALLRSVGVPYLAPIIPFRPQEFKDVFYRGDLKKLINSEHKYPHDDKE
ncbi:spore gernimation protein GerA [Bacillus sp. AFS077874]|uniref:spore germination protein n=1 Tax=Bacillus sp. AFS077874 TaxID=2033513 RepID=UPI000BF31A5C|nr:spore germination protein [Bacillus sp. AFS077874]PFM76128.1 spore gernimation protein GerA [Bacillus sp. AFS077874]